MKYDLSICLETISDTTFEKALLRLINLIYNTPYLCMWLLGPHVGQNKRCKLESRGFSPALAIDINDTPPPPTIPCGEFAQKLPRTPTNPTLPGGWLNKAMVETAGYFYSRHRGQKCSSETRTQGFPGQECRIGGSRRRRNCRRGHRGHSAARARPYAPAGTAASRDLQGDRHKFIWTRPGLRLGDRDLLARGQNTGRDKPEGSVGVNLSRNRQ